MKAVLLSAPFKLELKDIEKPVSGDHDVLTKVEATDICGLDLHTYRGTHPFRIPPLFLEHEFAGGVEEIRKKVNNIQLVIPLRLSLGHTVNAYLKRFGRDFKVRHAKKEAFL
jgi:threonine dehydrogenase-like Zn-dependent dehydrogenase